MTDEVDVLPPEPVRLDLLARAVEPIAKMHFESEQEREREQTKRLEMQINAQRDARVAAESAASMDKWRDFGIIMLALAAFFIAIVYGIYAKESTVINSAMVGIGTFFGGFGLGRSGRKNTD